ncbi:MAG: hypothetical protein H6581_22235 [Bacteroidia bacterium]|nr:hypothetical protein [Bacteroidia bacterium]
MKTGRLVPDPEKAAFWLLAGFLVFMSAVLAFFTPRTEMLDEISLFNPVYTFVQTGKMTYPAHGFFNSMVPHPPTHYLIIGLLIRLGIPYFYALTLPSFLLVLGIIAMLRRGPFSFPTRLGLLAGLAAPFFVGVFVINVQSLRPDYTLALAWYAGLIALERGRLQGWHKGWLLGGSMLMTLAASLHYFAFPALAGAGIYLLWAWKELGWRETLRRGKFVVAGGLLVGLPFLLGFVLPNFREILGQVLSKGAAEGGGRSVAAHWNMYEMFHITFPAIDELLLPGIPLFLIGMGLLALSAQTRALALGGTPLLLFIFFFAPLKSAGYFLPEMFVLFAGIWLMVFSIIDGLARKRGWVKTAGWMSFFVVFVLVTNGISDNATALKREFSWKARTSEMDLARACTRQILGNEAKVAGKLGLWYIGGGAVWHDLTAEFLVREDLAGWEEKEYFARFDAIAEHNARSNYSLSRQQKTISSCYADGTLHLRGFYATHNGFTDSDLSALLFSANSDSLVEGFAFPGQDEVLHLAPDPQGSMVFYSFVADLDQDWQEWRREAAFYNVLFLPDPAQEPGQEDFQAREAVVWVIMDKEKFNALVQKSPPINSTLDLIFLKSEKIFQNDLLQELKVSDRTIIFER